MLKIWKYFLLLGLPLLALLIAYQIFFWPILTRDGQIIKLNFKKNLFAPVEQTLRLEIVKSTEKMQTGLSNREDMFTENGEEIDGMLFIYPKATVLKFWMKEMQFTIDICWLKQRQLQTCSRQINPSPDLAIEDLPIYRSPSPVDMALETKPGFLSDQLFGQFLFPSL